MPSEGRKQVVIGVAALALAFIHRVCSADCACLTRSIERLLIGGRVRIVVSESKIDVSIRRDRHCAVGFWDTRMTLLLNPTGVA